MPITLCMGCLVFIYGTMDYFLEGESFMIQQEKMKVSLSRMRRGIIAFLILIPFVDIFSVYYYPVKDFFQFMKVYNYQINWNLFYHPVFGSFLSGNSIGHLTQALFFWLLPITLLLLFSDYSILEKKSRMRDVYITKIGRKQYIKDKLLYSFLLPMKISAISFLINFVVVNIVMHKATDMLGMEQHIETWAGTYFYWQFHHLYLAYFQHLIQTVILVGLCGLMCQAVSFLFKDKKIVYVICFLIWILQFRERGLSEVIQPFTEYGRKDMLFSFGINIIITIFFVCLAVKRGVVEDEL